MLPPHLDARLYVLPPRLNDSVPNSFFGFLMPAFAGRLAAAEAGADIGNPGRMFSNAASGLLGVAGRRKTTKMHSDATSRNPSFTNSIGAPSYEKPSIARISSPTLSKLSALQPGTITLTTFTRPSLTPNHFVLTAKPSRMLSSVARSRAMSSSCPPPNGGRVVLFKRGPED